MENIYIAIKPSKSKSKKDIVSIIQAKSKQHIESFLEDYQVALIANGKYYPVDEESYESQYLLLLGGLSPTIQVDENFGIRGIESFISAETILDIPESPIGVYRFHGKLTGRLYKIDDFSKIYNMHINKNGYWLVFNFNLSGAYNEGYRDVNIKSDIPVFNGENYLLVGHKESDLDNYVCLTGNVTIDKEIRLVSYALKPYYKYCPDI